MAISIIDIGSPSNEIIYNSTAMGATVEGVKASSVKVYSLTIDNSANGGAATYLRLWNAASGSISNGTTAPDEIIYVPAGQVVTVNFFTGAAPGKTFGTALSAACVTTPGTAGAVSPSSSVIVSINFV